MAGLLGGASDLIFGGSNTRAAEEALERNRALYEGIDLPEYRELVPELYDNESANYQLLSEDPVLKSKQLEALAKFQDLASDGLSDVDRAGFAEARSMGDQMAKAKTGAALQDAQVRGVGGSGLEFAMRESGNQEAAQRAQQAALQQQAAAAQQRQQYMQAYANQLGATRDQDYRANAANTNVINDFNKMNTQGRNQVNAANVDQRNNAFQYNEGNKDKKFNNQMRRADGLAGVNTAQSQVGLANAAADAENRRALLGVAAQGGAMALRGS
jgi:hypothetical protein